MWGKLLSDTYQKVRTKADEVREQVSSAVQAQQATISKAREVLLSLGGGGGAAPAICFLSRGGADAFAAAAAAAHLSAEDVQRLLQREAGEIRSLEEARDLFTTWRQLILQSGLHGSPRFTSSGEQQIEGGQQQDQQHRWSDGSSRGRKSGAEWVVASSAEERKEDAASRRIHGAVADVKEKKHQQLDAHFAEGGLPGAPLAAAEQPPHVQQVADAEGKKGSGAGGDAAATSSTRHHDQPRTRAPQEGNSVAVTTDAHTAAAGARRPPDGGTLHSSGGTCHATAAAAVSPAAAAAGISYTVAIPPPTPPTFAAALEEEAARGERSCFADGFSFKEVFLRSTALERALLSLARKETLRVFFAAHVLELLVAVKKQHKQQQQLAAGREARKEAAGAASGSGVAGCGATGARAGAGGRPGCLETDRHGGIKKTDSAQETEKEMSRIACPETGVPAVSLTRAGSPAAAAASAEAAEATTTASPSSQTSHVSSSSSTTATEDGGGNSVDEGSNSSKAAEKQSADAQQHQMQLQQEHDERRGGTAAGGAVTAQGGGLLLDSRDGAPAAAVPPPPPPVVSALLALLSLCLPGTQEQHLMLLHALFTVATAAAAPAVAPDSTEQQRKQQRQLLREFYASGGQRSKGVLLTSGSRRSSRGRTLEQPKQRDRGREQQQSFENEVEHGRVTTEATTGGSATQRAAGGGVSPAAAAAAPSEAAAARDKLWRADRLQGSAALDSLVAAAEQQQGWEERSGTSASGGSTAVPTSSAGVAGGEGIATHQEALAAIERVLLLFSLWKRSWLLERREDARRRLEEEGRRLSAKIESCDLPVDGADGVLTSAGDCDAADPLVSHNIRLLANAQLLRLQQQVLLLKEELLQQQRAAAAEKVRRLKELQEAWETQDAAAAAAARHSSGDEQEIQNQMAEASEVLVQEAVLVEERRVALHQKLKSLQEKKLLLEQQLADCVQMIATAEREQQKLLHDEEDVHVELLHVQMQYKQQVQQHQQQQQQQARLQQALQELDSTAAGLADYVVLDAQRKEAAAVADIQRLQGALQTQVCRHFAFEKTRLQQQVHLLQHHVHVLEELLQQRQGQQDLEEHMGEEQRLQLLHARRRFIRAAHQLDVMYGETLSFAEQHRHILALAIHQQWQALRSRTQDHPQPSEGEERAVTATGNRGVLQDEQRASRKEEHDEQVDPMKDIRAIYATTKKQLAPYIARLASAATATAEARAAQDVRGASVALTPVPCVSGGEAAPAAGGTVNAATHVRGERVAGGLAQAEGEQLRVWQRQQQQQLQQQQQHLQQQQLQQQVQQPLHLQEQEGIPTDLEARATAAVAAAGAAVLEKDEEPQHPPASETGRLCEAAGDIPLLVQKTGDRRVLQQQQQHQWRQQEQDRPPSSQGQLWQPQQHCQGQQAQPILPEHRFEQQQQAQEHYLQNQRQASALEAAQLFELTTPPSSPRLSPHGSVRSPAAAQHGSVRQQHGSSLEEQRFDSNLQLFSNGEGQQQHLHFSSKETQQALHEQQRQQLLETEEPKQRCTTEEWPHHFTIGQQQSSFPHPPRPLQAEGKDKTEEDLDNNWLL